MPKSVTQSETHTHTHKKYKWATKQLQSFRPSGEIKNQKKNKLLSCVSSKERKIPHPSNLLKK
jgi:hypothetical protein